MKFPFVSRGGLGLVILFAVALAGATVMNWSLISQTRRALDEGILGNPSQGKILRYHLALVIPDSPDAFFGGLRDGVLGEAAGAEVAVQVFLYHANAPEEVESLFQLCLSSRVDGIILYAGPDGHLANRATRAKAAGVAFIPVGTSAAPRGEQGFIGSSSLLQGLESGNQLAQRLGKSARVGLLLPSEGEDPREDPVYQGVAAALQSFPGARIVRAARAEPGPLSGEAAASALLAADPGVNVLVCATAPITEGAVQVVVDQGRVGKILIIGTDRSPAIDRLIDRGVIAASVVRDSRRMGTEAVKAFVGTQNGTPFLHSVEVGFLVRGRKEASR